MKKTIFAATTSLAIMVAPAFADEALPAPPTEPYYAPEVTTCDAVDLQIYFEPGTAELTSFARDAIRETREQLSGCAVLNIDATSKAGDADTEAAKLSLAEARRATVMQELRAHGIQSAKTNLKTDVSADSAKVIMARGVDVKMKAEPAIIG
ncbi:MULTISPECIES: OmpA family protein [Henriciella]|jgi:hypothetical protein|uniref:OmpA-like domain-containing protein n=1 Tax=Henriciella pelagia TaxID=1977912 RepID=A0ABQ1J2E3_9PROT|nr:OmpA family protein [Henriciella pelagia]GGB58069.1 hypothetical protein GCM10011503_03100 [Henriciella pelagia]